MFSFPKSLSVCLPNRHSHRLPPVQQAHCRRMTAEFSSACSANRLFRKNGLHGKKGTLIHVGAKTAQYKGNAAPGFTPCLPKLLFHKFGGIFSKTKKDCFPAISAENFGFSAAYIFWLSPKSHLFRRVVFLGFSRVGKTLNRYSLPAIHVRRTGSRACCKMVPAFPHLGCTGQKPPRVFHAESLWLPRHSDLSGICRWSDSFFTHNNT